MVRQRTHTEGSSLATVKAPAGEKRNTDSPKITLKDGTIIDLGMAEIAEIKVKK